MCRWAAWSGAPRYLEDLICNPVHSLIRQSRHAQACLTAVNGDGFGMAWYGARPEPCIYKDVHPAWSDPNLNQLAHHTSSGLFLAHVRASTGTDTTYANCHPFSHGRWSFMHNGQIGGYERIRKTVDAMIPDALYSARKGATDSEALFLIALGLGLDRDPVGAIRAAVQVLEDLSRERGALPHMRFAACWSDGARLFAARYASDDAAPSMFYRDYGDGVLIVSEPLDAVPDVWTPVAAGSVIVIENGAVTTAPFDRAKAAA